MTRTRWRPLRIWTRRRGCHVICAFRITSTRIWRTPGAGRTRRVAGRRRTCSSTGNSGCPSCWNWSLGPVHPHPVGLRIWTCPRSGSPGTPLRLWYGFRHSAFVYTDNNNNNKIKQIQLVVYVEKSFYSLREKRLRVYLYGKYNLLLINIIILSGKIIRTFDTRFNILVKKKKLKIKNWT